MKRALVLGAGGFIGSHMVNRLKSEGFWVRGVDLKYPDFEKSTADEFIIGDLRDQKLAEEVISLDDGDYVSANGFDELYQFAADMGGAGYVFTGEHDADIMHNSAQINLNVAFYAVKHKVKRLFYSSSACMYPSYNQEDPLNPNCKEDSAYPANPDSEYGWEKLFSERVFLSFKKNYGLDAHIARYHNIFGPCFDEQTEVLTLDGWKYFKDIDINKDFFATMDDDNNMLYLKAIDKQNYFYNGDMYKVENPSVSQLITPNHKVFCSTLTTRKDNDVLVSVKTKFKLRKCKDIKWNSNKIFFTSYFNWNGNDLPLYYELNKTDKIDGRKLHGSKKVFMKDWFRFIGWYLSEGSMFKTPTNHTVCITQYEKVNSNNRLEIKNLLKRMNINFSEDELKTQIIISDKQIFKQLESENIGTGCVNKKIPKWMLQANKELLNELYDSMMKGDGNKTGKRYNTTSTLLKDDFMELAIKLGKTVNAKLEISENENHNDIWRISLTDRKYFCTRRYSRTIEKYSGYVYDVTLPMFHLLLVRRNGKVCWSGNCGTYQGGKEKSPAALCRKVILAPNNGEIEVWGPGNQTRSFLYIDECIEATQRLLRSDFVGPVNIGSEEMVTINQLAQMCIDISGKNLTIKNIPGPVGVNGRNSDNNLIRAKLNWDYKQSLYEGLVKTYNWIKKQYGI